MKARTRERIDLLELQLKESREGRAAAVAAERGRSSKLRDRLLRAGLIDMASVGENISWSQEYGRPGRIDLSFYVQDDAHLDAFQQGMGSAFAGNKTPRANRALRNYERSVRPWR